MAYTGEGSEGDREDSWDTAGLGCEKCGTPVPWEQM